MQLKTSAIKQSLTPIRKYKLHQFGTRYYTISENHITSRREVVGKLVFVYRF